MRWIILLCASALVSGCANPGNYCDIASSIYFGSDDTVEWLAHNDEDLLRSVVGHNETRARLCR